MSQPLSPHSDVLDDGGFYDANIGRLGYRVRVSHTSLERAIVAKNTGGNYPSIMRDIVVCQCDGTAKEVDACLMGMKIREGIMGQTRVYPNALENSTLILPDIEKLKCHPLALIEIRTKCNEQAYDTLMDYQGA